MRKSRTQKKNLSILQVNLYAVNFICLSVDYNINEKSLTLSTYKAHLPTARTQKCIPIITFYFMLVCN